MAAARSAVAVERLDHPLAEAARRYGERPALVQGDVTLSYAELDHRVTHLADELRARGVGPGARAGVYLPRGVNAVTAIYAVLRAGAVVAPLETSDPARRTGRIAQGCGLDVLVADRDTVPAARRVTGPGADADAAGEAALGYGLRLLPLPRPANPAPVMAGDPDPAGGYIFSTSGSTGWPKGVLLSHGNILHFARWAAAEFGLTPDDRIGAQSALTFDLSTFDIFASALAGASVRLLPEGLLAFPREVAHWLRTGRVSVFYAVPTLLGMLRQRGLDDADRLPDLRILAMAGEAIPPEVLRWCLRRLPDATVYNLYGPTETNVCTYERVPAGWTGDRPVSIGRAIDGVRTVLLDDAGRPATEGELYVAGPTVLRGYLEDGRLRDPTRTVSFPDDRRRRAYGTGDRARLGPDGRLFLLGRNDDQVKRRGHRIELRDVESALLETCRPESCAVVAKRGPYAGEIWAYVVAAGTDEALVASRLAEVLPRRMLPDRIVLVPSLPTTTHGKVDRRGLAELATGREIP